MMMDPLTSRPRGFVFVTMSSAEAAQNCIAGLNSRDVNDRAITVNIARPREERPGGSNRH